MYLFIQQVLLSINCHPHLTTLRDIKLLFYLCRAEKGTTLRCSGIKNTVRIVGQKKKITTDWLKYEFRKKWIGKRRK